MRRLQIAEWVLALSMTRGRAEAVAGDLREAERGEFWFWRSVVATMITGVWSGVRSAPWRLTGIALGGFILVFVAGSVILGLSLQRSAEFEHRVNILLNVATLFLAGRWTARFSRGRELASWVAWTLLTLAIMVSVQAARLVLGFPNLYVSYAPMPWILALLGAISARVRPRLLSSN